MHRGFDACDSIRKLVLRSGHDCHRCAGCRQLLRDNRPQAATAAGDQRYLATQIDARPVPTIHVLVHAPPFDQLDDASVLPGLASSESFSQPPSESFETLRSKVQKQVWLR
jgi:hypothetical protein